MRLPLGTAHEHPLCARGQRRWAIVVPIIFLEFLVLSMSRTIIPELIDDQYGESSYVVYGSADGARGLLAFLATPAVGALSDELGRKWLFLVTVVGSSSPIIVLAFSSRLDAHLCVWALSGLFAATFPLAFAYISDHVPAPSLVQAYGITLTLTLTLTLTITLAITLTRTPNPNPNPNPNPTPSQADFHTPWTAGQFHHMVHSSQEDRMFFFGRRSEAPLP